MSIKVAIADDHRLVAESLKTMLERKDPTIDVVFVAADGDEAVRKVTDTVPDVLLMDLRMPRVDGVAAIRAISATHPSVRVVALTTFEDDELVFGALDAGACGYVLKDMTSEELVKCVHQAARGEAPLSPRVAAKLVRHTQRTLQGGATGPEDDVRPVARSDTGIEVNESADLTPREREVLTLVAHGLSTAEIASELYISAGTVKNHINAIYQNLDLHSRAELVLFAIEHGYVEGR